MFAARQLEKAILRNDISTIELLVERHGVELLYKKLPGRFKRGQAQPGDRWLKRVFKHPLPLTLALYMADDDTVAALVRLGAHPRQMLDYNFPNHLFVAAALSRLRILDEWMASYPALRDMRNHDNDHLLHIAAQHGQAAVVAMLLAHGGFPLAARSQTYGCTPLMYAERIQYAGCVALLLEAEVKERQSAHTYMPLPAGGPAARWHHIDDLRIARLSTDTQTGARLAEIFNFKSKNVWTITQAKPDVDATATLVRFSASADPAAVADAAARLGLPAPKVRKDR